MGIRNRLLLAMSVTVFVMAATESSIFGQSAQATLRITFPRNGSVVRPGQDLSVRVTGPEGLSTVGILGGSYLGRDPLDAGALLQMPGRPPWNVPVAIPLKTDPGLYALAAFGRTSSGVELHSDDTLIDVEPEIMPRVSFSQPALSVPVESCIVLRGAEAGSDAGADLPRPCGGNLFVSGTYEDGTTVTLNGSTKITFTSQAPRIARVSKGGAALVGVSPGQTKLVVDGKYSINVTVVGQRP